MRPCFYDGISVLAFGGTFTEYAGGVVQFVPQLGDAFEELAVVEPRCLGQEEVEPDLEAAESVREWSAVHHKNKQATLFSSR